MGCGGGEGGRMKYFEVLFIDGTRRYVYGSEIVGALSTLGADAYKVIKVAEVGYWNFS
jgi:hypothetical protein